MNRIRLNTTFRMATTLITGLLFAAACQSQPTKPAQESKDAAAARAQRGKALFEEKCRTVAGEKIYRKVEGVVGVLLMKVRPQRGSREWADLMWEGAAFAEEFGGDTFIESFLLYEQRSGTNRGHVDSTATRYPGYRYVDVIDESDGKRYRYTGSKKVVGKKDVDTANVKLSLSRDPNYDLNVYRWTLDRTSDPDPSARYGVTYEDHVIPDERVLGLASSTVKVIDLQTNEVLGEMTRYAWSPGQPSRANPSPWLTAYKCGGEGTASTSRFFVDKVLSPRKEK